MFQAVMLISAAIAAAPAQNSTVQSTNGEVAGKSPDEVICKRVNKTGSLVSSSRLCLTRREWIRYAEENQDRFCEIQGRYGSSHPQEPEFGALPPISPPN